MKTVKLVLAVILLLTIVACTDEGGSRRVLEQQGYTNIRFTGYRGWLCGEDYTYHTGFEADLVVLKPSNEGLRPVTNHVTGAVCSGVMKGYSIKLD